MDATNLATLYDLPPLDWDELMAGFGTELTQAPGTGGPDRHSCWLATIDGDGRPHVTGIGAIWHRGAFWFETGEATRKGRNLARDPRCSISVATQKMDLVVEGTASVVTDPVLVAEVAQIWASGGWPCEVDESGTHLTAPFSAPSAGSPPWSVYRIDATSAVALAVTGEGGATRWHF